MNSNGVSHRQMWDEIDEVSDRIASEWEIDFLTNVKSKAYDNTLTERQAAVLEKIYDKACRSPY